MAIEIKVYVDGACSGNPGPGGWAFVLVAMKDGKEIKRKTGSGGLNPTTNNQMELMAVLHAVRQINSPTTLTVHTDSNNVIGWMSGKFKAKNADIKETIAVILGEAKNRGVALEFEKVEAHAGVELNELCDQMAKAEIKKERECSL